MLDMGLLTGGLPAGLFQLGLSVALLGLAVLSALGFYFTGRATVKAAKAVPSESMEACRPTTLPMEPL